jgi:hypothetical protein
MHKFFNNLRYDPKNLMSGMFILFLVLLSSVSMPAVPNFLVTLMSNTTFKLLYMTGILFTFNYSAKYAFLLSLVFILLLQTINNFQKTKLNNTLTAALTNIANSATDSASDLLSDAGKIFTTVGDTISDVVSEASNYLSKELFVDGQPVSAAAHTAAAAHGAAHGASATHGALATHGAVHGMVVPHNTTGAVHAPVTSATGAAALHEGFESEPADVTHYIDQYTGKPFTSSLGQQYDKNDAFFTSTEPHPLVNHDSLAPYGGSSYSEVFTNELLNPELHMSAAPVKTSTKVVVKNKK